MAEVRLVNRNTGSVVVVDEEKAAGLWILGFDAEPKKAPAKKAAASKKSSK